MLSSLNVELTQEMSEQLLVETSRSELHKLLASSAGDLAKSTMSGAHSQQFDASKSMTFSPLFVISENLELH